MPIMLRMTVDDRHGVLDRITGIIRRNGWNITSINAGGKAHGYSDINIRLEDRGADVLKLGKSLSKLDCVSNWESCSVDTHMVRELFVLKIRERDCPRELLEASRVMRRSGGLLWLEHTGLPIEIDRLIVELNGRIVNCARSGVLCLNLDEEEPAHG